MIIKKFCFFTLLLLFSNFSNSMQFDENFISLPIDEQNDTVILFFGEKLNTEKLSAGDINNYNWSLKNETYSITGNGEELFNSTLETPGIYTLDLTPSVNLTHTHDEECSHNTIAKKININVLPYRIEFQFSKSKFSNQIKGEVETEGTIFTIPVTIFFNGINSINFDNLKLKSSGINTTIVGEIVDSEKNYSSGKNNLIFKLKGKATSETYIMFDIFNGEKLISTYYYPNKITN
jgi:hypothetical protein